MFKTNFSGHKIIWGAQNIGGTAPIPRGYGPAPVSSVELRREDPY